MISEPTAHINPRVTLAPALQAWEIYLSDQGSSPHTITAFLGDLRLLASYLPPDRQVGEINMADLNNFLRWMEHERGIPCITGERKTNAPAFLTQRIGVMAVQAAAEAAASAETTSVVSDAGSVTNSVTGDTGNFVLGKTIAGGSDEVAQWLQERQSQSFDAVFVPAGTRIAIHVDHELPIDLDTTGRKLNHATSVDPFIRTQLD